MTHHAPEQTFTAFWSVYPRHIAKKDALKAWIKLDPSPALVDQILEALVWQSEKWTDLQFCPYPSTWIRSERWTDEPTPTKPRPPVLTRFASLGMNHRKT